MASEITINDTRDFHRYEKPGHIHTEATFAYVMSINRDRASSGEPYGKILAAKLHRELKPEHNKPLQIAEVGPGNGQPAASFLIGLAIEHDASIRYKAIELSPNLIKSSRLSAPDFQTQISEYVAIEYLEGDAHSLVDFLEADSLDMFIANEMVGDMLTIDNVPRSMLTGEMDIQSAGLAPKIADCVADVRRIIGTYDLPVPDRERVAYNYGALLLVEQAFSRIKPGGVLFLSEHSSEIPFPVVASVAHEYSGIAGKSMATLQEQDGNPRPVAVGDGEGPHIEYNVRFSDVELLAKKVGYRLVERGKLVDLVDIRGGKSADFQDFHPFFEALPADKQEKISAKVFENIPAITDDPKALSYIFAMYLGEHPEILRKALPADQQSLFDQVLFDTRDFYAQMEYVMLKK